MPPRGLLMHPTDEGPRVPFAWCPAVVEGRKRGARPLWNALVSWSWTHALVARVDSVSRVIDLLRIVPLWRNQASG